MNEDGKTCQYCGVHGGGHGSKCRTIVMNHLDKLEADIINKLLPYHMTLHYSDKTCTLRQHEKREIVKEILEAQKEAIKKDIEEMRLKRGFDKLPFEEIKKLLKGDVV